MFKKYQHVEKYGNQEVENINLGECFIFPKIDGTNGSIWNDNGKIVCGSRNREVSIENDNQGFCKYINEQENIKEFLIKYPDLRLFGEWLISHSLKTYRDEAWRKFYIFDVTTDIEGAEDRQEKFKYINYNDYKLLLDEFDIDYIPPLRIIKNPTYENLIKCLEENIFLIQDGSGAGEGIVIKNYEFQNKYGRTTWGKIVTSDFKEKHNREMGAPISKGTDMVEEKIVDNFVTTALIEKEYHKIITEMSGWSSKYILRLFNTVYYCLITEEMWQILKKHKKCKIDFSVLFQMIVMKIKKIKPELF